MNRWPPRTSQQSPFMLGAHVLLIRGAGEMATGVAHRLFCAGFVHNIIMSEVSNPLAVRRAVSFCECLHQTSKMHVGYNLFFR